MSKFAIGIEIGATKQQVCIADATGSILETILEEILYCDARDIIAWVEKNIKSVMAKHKLTSSMISKICCGFGGPIEFDTGKVLISNQVKGWENFQLKKWLEDAFQVPVLVVNDTVAGGFGELMIGAGQKSSNFFYTNIGSGVGGALFFNRKYYDGIGRGAGYIGHTLIPDWTKKTPGAYATLEDICSGFAIESRLQSSMYIPKNSIMMDFCRNQRKDVTCKMLGDAAIAGDMFALDEVDRIAFSFGLGLSNVLTLCSLDTVVIGGGVSKIGDILIDKIKKHTNDLVFISAKDHFTIYQSELLDDAVVVGAILMGLFDGSG